MATEGTGTTAPLGESFGSIEDIEQAIAFGYEIESFLSSLFDINKEYIYNIETHLFNNNSDFFELYEESKNIYLESLDYYRMLLEKPNNSIHAKQLIDFLYRLYQSGLSGNSGTIKRNRIKDWWNYIRNLGNIPLKTLLLLLQMINDYLASFAKALQCADALDEVKKFAEHLLTANEIDKELNKREDEQRPRGPGNGYFEL
ncbi:hypothetical protein [Robertkochia solimangrovi]|uniref:hypothetical protein n=1 Tax=Robertkochia solimangrovi TaxID=2213046 RepID=UPI00117CD2F2|nr:hypothetical protein [Robertkochia solimangrovi]TRZ41653.1 hypothetical protein DMZ48_16730 [Robertkochia solimangrovi]